MWRFGCEKLQLFQTKLATTTSEEGRGAWGWRRDCCPAAFPLTLAGAPQLKLYQTRACACYKLCKIWQQGRAAEFQPEALFSELNCYNFWTGLSQVELPENLKGGKSFILKCCVVFIENTKGYLGLGWSQTNDIYLVKWLLTGAYLLYIYQQMMLSSYKLVLWTSLNVCIWPAEIGYCLWPWLVCSGNCICHKILWRDWLSVSDGWKSNINVCVFYDIIGISSTLVFKLYVWLEFTL